ncbi:MAG: aminotransferase class I/II-fold pyridoxal phosphate-dependent enzyme [Rhodospirillales bacterium]|nr:aminotransferase class I/II-fold pyridoxal phosphate-dependent enzyme [Rhodospirillales bacterium]
MIDLRSDTVTRPTPAMRAVMAAAEVGDDVYADDPTVRALEERTAELLGYEAAVYMPSGTMTNQVALRAHTECGDAILCHSHAHIAVLERGAPAALSGLSIIPLAGAGGVFSAAALEAAIPSAHPFIPAVQAPPRLVCIENTHNVGGGTVWPLATLQEVIEAARRLGLRLHLDGARLWNASVASMTSEADLAAGFDSVSVCFSKGLGAPVGSALAGSAAFIARARRFRALFGGGLRQAGLIAAGALFALDHHRERLREDHANAQRLASGLAGIDGIAINADAIVTNIVRFQVETMTAGQFVDRCHAAGVFLLPSGTNGVRALTHLDVSETDVDLAVERIGSVMSEAGRMIEAMP